MNFELLQARLRTNLQARVRNGEITERRLALISGISQPHMHNVLKGARALSMEMADQILQRLGLDLLKLVEPEAAMPNPAAECGCGVPVLDGAIGPGHPYPRREKQREVYPFQAADIRGLENPVAARAAPDPRLRGWLGHGGVILLDRSEDSRTHLDGGAYYAVDLGKHSALRRVQRAGRRIYIVEEQAGYDSGGSVPVPVGEREVLDVVKGRVRALMLRM